MRYCHLLFILAALGTVAETRFVRTVPWHWAGDYFDQDVYVTGKVVSSYETGGRCFLRFDNENKHSFVVIISGEQLKKQPFATPVHAMYVDQPVRVRGIVRENKDRNRAEMHVEDLSKIEYGDDVLAQPLPLPDEIPEPEPEPEPAPVPEPEENVADAPMDLPEAPVPEPENTVADAPMDLPEEATETPIVPEETPAVPLLDPGPALMIVPAVDPEELAIDVPEPEEVEAPVAVPEPPTQIEIPVEIPLVPAAPKIDDSVVEITLDDAVLDLAPPKPEKPKFRKLALSEMNVQIIASSTSKAFPGEEEAEVIVDGKQKGSFWSSESSDAQEITIDLKAQFLLRNLGLHWESPAAKYYVRTSQDGVIWTTSSEEESLDKGPRADRVRFAKATTARFVRIQMLERVVHTRGYSLFELELLGSPAP